MPPPRDVDVWMGSLPQGVDGARVRAAFERASFRPTRVVVKKRAFKRDGETFGFAFVSFASGDEARRAVRALHGKELALDLDVPGGGGGGEGGGDCNGDDGDASSRTRTRFVRANLRVASETPRTLLAATSFDVSLASQLAPLDAATLASRLRALGWPRDESGEAAAREAGGDGAARLFLLRRLLSAHGEGDADASSFAGTLLPRSVRRRCVILPTREYVRAVPGETLKSAIATLSTLKWPRASHRVGVASSEYLSLSSLGFERETEDRTSTVASPPSPGQNARRRRRMRRYRAVWELARDVLASVAGDDVAAKFDGLAVTKNFSASPHRDTLDVAPQYVCAFGDYYSHSRPGIEPGGVVTETETGEDGTSTVTHLSPEPGTLCVEIDRETVGAIDTRDGVACVDGRAVHWVQVSAHVLSMYIARNSTSSIVRLVSTVRRAASTKSSQLNSFFWLFIFFAARVRRDEVFARVVS